MKALIESWARLSGADVLAKTVYQSASRTPDIQHFVPVRDHDPSAFWVARVRMPMTSLPAWGSERPKAARWVPSAIGGR